MVSIYSPETTFAAQAISQQRGGYWLFRHVSLQLQAKEALYLQGPNGAGKTTLLRVLTGLLSPTVGDVTWCDHSITHSESTFSKNRVYLGHQDGLRRGLTVFENLRLSSCLTNNIPPLHDEVMKNLEILRLADKAAIQVEALSAGQRRRLALGRILMSKAQLWILDEPLTSLDKAGIELFYTHMENHLAKNGMIILTSHQTLQAKFPVKQLHLQEVLR